MAKDSNKRPGRFDIEQSGGGALSGLLDEEEEFDRRAIWRLGTWAAVSVGAVIIAILANQSTIGIRKELTASADLVRQAQQMQLTAKDNLAETRRLAAAIETLNGDRDRLYSRVSVLEQGLDSVTGTIAKQNSATSPAPPSASLAPPAAAPHANVAAASSSTPVVAAAPAPAAPAPAAPAETAATNTPPAPSKPPIASAAPVPAVAPVAATPSIATDKTTPKPAPSEPVAVHASVSAPSQPPQTQTVSSLVAPKSMMAPPDPAATRLIEPSVPPKTVTSAPIPEVVAAPAKAPDNEAVSEISATVPELAVKRTEFGVDVGGANSIPGLRALWRGLLKSRANAALTSLHPIIVIKENSKGLGMQLRLVAGPISDAAAAAKICATLTLSERSCATAVFEGQRLALNPEDQIKAEAQAAPEATSAIEAKPTAAPKGSPGRHYAARHAPKEDAPKPEQPSTLSTVLFGKP